MIGRSGRRAAVHVRIEELRLEGFRPGDRYRIARAVERELARLLRARDGDSELGSQRDVARAAGSFSFRADDPPHRIGTAIARATFRGLTGWRDRDRER
jgi:hypothetical protein